MTDTTTQIEKDVENTEGIGGVSFKNMFTIGSMIGFIIAGTFVIHAYLDILKIKKLRQEMKESGK